VANGQSGAGSGADPAYVEHVRAHGTVLVAEERGRVAGFGAALPHGQARLLADLFVDPAAQGRGVGGRLLARLWPATDTSPRITFASQDPRALSLYLRAGLAAWWPLLYLRGHPERLPALGDEPSTVRARRVSPSDAADAETHIAGGDRRAGYAYWAGGDPAAGVVVTVGDEVAAAGVLNRTGLAHLACPDPRAATACLLAALRLDIVDGLTAHSGHLVCLPGPHPALATLLHAGYQIVDRDHYCADRFESLSTSWVYSPGLG
jgi:hypothetical protein